MSLLRLEIHDTDDAVIRALAFVFSDLDRVKVHVQPIAEPGFCADAVVSPANSFGFMDGGVDLIYSQRFGWHVQDSLQGIIKQKYDGELLVGQAQAVLTRDECIPWLIAAPTMRVPQRITDPVAIRLAMRAALRAADEAGCEHVVSPGMGTGTGRVPPEVAALQMRAGWNDFVDPPPFPKSWREAWNQQYTT